MTTFTEARRTGEYIISEANGTRSREAVVIASGSGVLQSGTVLGKVTATGEYGPYLNTDTTTGLGTAVAVLYAKVDATSVDVPATVTARDAEVTEALLTGIDAAGKVDLAAVGIIVR
jgi:hypothetical protein